MAGPPLSFAPLIELCELLTDADVPAALDPADLNGPGAWVTVDQVVTVNLAAGHRIDALVFLIHGDTDYRRALDGLADLFNKMLTVLSPDGPVRPQSVVLPGDATPLPALRVPVQLFDTTGE